MTMSRIVGVCVCVCPVCRACPVFDNQYILCCMCTSVCCTDSGRNKGKVCAGRAGSGWVGSVLVCSLLAMSVLANSLRLAGIAPPPPAAS